MGTAGKALMALIVDAGALEPDQRKHTAKVQIHFLEVRKLPEDSRRCQPIVRMVVDDLRTHGIEELVVELRARTLKKCIRFPAGPDAVHDITAIRVSVDHIFHGGHIVLPVAVDGNHYVSAVLGLHESGENGALVTSVPALSNTGEHRILKCQRRNDLPC